MKYLPTTSMILTLGLVLWGATTRPVKSHGVVVQSQQTSAIEIQAIYDSGEPLANAQVKIYASDNPAQLVQSGVTDASGRFIFAPTQRQGSGTWDVQVRSAGHGGSLSIPITMPQEGVPTLVSDPFVQQTQRLTGLQLVMIVGAIAWGCIGTALFFSRAGLTSALSAYPQQSAYQHPSK